MNITPAAQANHDELFPGHVSQLAVTDPEFVELFDNFAFDEVIAHGGLSTRLRLQVTLAAVIAVQALNEYRVMLGAALNVGVTPVEAKEILYQAVPYVGQAKAFDFLHVTNEVMVARGVTLPLERQSTTTPATREAAGLALRRAIFGEATDAAYDAGPAGQRHLQDYLSANCFGDFYTRTGLDLATRELLTFAMLVSMGGCEPQVRGHIRGNLTVGNDKALLLDVVTQLLPWIGYPRSLNAVACLNEVAP
jgi:4-carboxymuconolactone decarboxylase